MACREAQVLRLATPSRRDVAGPDRKVVPGGARADRRDYGASVARSEDDLQSELHLAAGVARPVGSGLLPERSAWRALVKRLAEGRGVDVSVRISPIQAVGGVVGRHLEFSL